MAADPLVCVSAVRPDRPKSNQDEGMGAQSHSDSCPWLLLINRDLTQVCGGTFVANSDAAGTDFSKEP